MKTEILTEEELLAPTLMEFKPFTREGTRYIRVKIHLSDGTFEYKTLYPEDTMKVLMVLKQLLVDQPGDVIVQASGIIQ